MTQKKQILNYMKAKGSITGLDALTFCGCMRLSARIADLKADGYKIKTDFVKTATNKTIARYSLA